MIHSMSGGVVREKKFYDFAKVQLEISGETRFFICNDKNLKEGDCVLVPYGKNDLLEKGKILRIDRNVNEQVAPMPVGRMKEIFGKVCRK
ncbi:MAG: hypothetical protein ACI4R8_04860 [Candidatus Caccovivens sp.]